MGKLRYFYFVPLLLLFWGLFADEKVEGKSIKVNKEEIAQADGEEMEGLFDVNDVDFSEDVETATASESSQKVQRRSYHKNGKLKKIQTLTRGEDGQFIEHGVEVNLYPNGLLKSRGLLVKGERSGKWVFVSEAGNITQGEYQAGKRSSSWKVWTAEKVLVINEQYIDDELHGMRQTYHPNGKFASQVFYSKGTKQGLETHWFSNGNKATEVNWVDDVQHGEIWKWDDNGETLLKGSYFMGIPDGDWEWYDLEGNRLQASTFNKGTGVLFDYTIRENPESGGKEVALQREGSFREGKIHGTEIVYHPNGKIKSEYHFKDGKKDGDFKEWYSNGSLRVEGSYHKDVPSGILKEYFVMRNLEAGSLPSIAKEVVYDEDMIHAMVTEFSAKGTKLSIMALKDGVPHGEFTGFYPEGKVMRSGQFDRGRRVGEWREYHPSGALFTFQEFLLDKEHGNFEIWYDHLADVNEDEEEEREAQIKLRGQFVNGEKNGEWKTWYPNASMESTVLFENGVEVGEYREWWPKDPTSSEEQRDRTIGQFVLGEKHGTWKIWYPNGLLKSQGNFQYGTQEGIAEEWYDYLIDKDPVVRLRGNYVNGEQDGVWEAFFNDGTPELSQTYREGKLNGEVLQYFSTGVLKSKAQFRENVQDGEALIYHPNEKLDSKLFFFAGRKHGPFVSYHEGGKLAVRGTYQMDIPVDLWQWFDEDGKTVLASTEFSDGRGTMYEFYSDGQKKSETEYVDGMEHGKQMRWHENGQLRSETFFHRGLVHGSYKEYHENGTLLAESTWIYGRRNGSYLSWYGNEQQQLSIFFVDDLPHGQSTEWYENGNVKSEGTWVQGERDGEWTWYDRYGDSALEQSYDIGIMVHSEGDLEESFSEE